MKNSNRASLLAQMLSDAEAEKDRLQKENDELRKNQCKRSPDEDPEEEEPSCEDEPSA